MRGQDIVLFLVLCAACRVGPDAPGERGQPGPGIDLFAFAPGDDRLRIAAEPRLVVGLKDSLPLDLVSGAVFFGDGIAIASLWSYELLIVDSAGNLVFRQGGKGDGPGEYKYLAGVFRHDDGLITWDASHSRVTLLDSEGRYLSETKIRPRRGTSRVVGAFGNSVLLEVSEPGFPGRKAIGPLEIRQEVEYTIVRLSDGVVTFEGKRPGEEQWAAREGERDSGMTHGGLPVIFGRQSVAAVTEQRAFIGTTDSLTLTGYDETGTGVVIAFDQTRVSARMEWEQLVRDSTRTYLEGRGPGKIVLGNGRNFVEVITAFDLGLLKNLPARPTLPSFSAILGGADGRLWIREYPNPVQDYVAWIGFSDTWVREKRIKMPQRLHILDISEDKVLVLGKGEYDENLVEVYSIERW